MEKDKLMNLAAFMLETVGCVEDDITLPAPGKLAELNLKYTDPLAYKDLEWKDQKVLEAWAKKWHLN